MISYALACCKGLAPMNISFRLLGAICLLFILGYVGYSLYSSPLTQIAESSAPAIIQELMTGVHAKRYDVTGRLIQVVTIQSWTQLKGENVTHMIAPTLKAFHSDGSLWDISADKGEGFQADIGTKIDKLLLSENVSVKQFGQSEKNEWELTTQELLFFPQQPTALTDAPIVVNGNGLEIHAVGLRAYLDSHRVEFIKDVKTYYETNI